MLIGRQWHYLGEYNSPKSHEKYHRLVEEFCQRHAQTQISGVTIAALAAVYKSYSQERYQGATLKLYHRTMQRFAILFPELDSQDLACSHLEAYQISLVQRKLTANTINDYLARLKTIFRWAARNKYMPAQNLLFFESHFCFRFPMHPYYSIAPGHSYTL